MNLTPCDYDFVDNEPADVAMGHLQEELPEQYELLARVGQGGMGTIFKARNRYTGMVLAIKVMRAEPSLHPSNQARFVREAKAASALHHPNICEVLDFGRTADGTLYLVMAWIEGISLAEKCKRDGPIPVIEAIRIFQQVALGLAFSHKNQVIHRDLKPENVMISRDPDGRTVARLVDFGIAKFMDDEDAHTSKALTRAGFVVGTPLFMSPEQARSGYVDCRSDIYSLGCLMYYALTGMAPFDGTSVLDIMQRHCSDTPPEFDPRLKIPPVLARIVAQAMEKDPQDRYQRAEQLLSDLKKMLKGVSLKQPRLSRERKSARQKIAVTFCFLAGFALTYALSICLQNFFDHIGVQESQHIRNK